MSPFALTRVTSSHPFAKSAKGWGTRALGMKEFRSRPFAKSAKGWGTHILGDCYGVPQRLKPHLKERLRRPEGRPSGKTVYRSLVRVLVRYRGSSRRVRCLR